MDKVTGFRDVMRAAYDRGYRGPLHMAGYDGRQVEALLDSGEAIAILRTEEFAQRFWAPRISVWTRIRNEPLMEPQVITPAEHFLWMRHHEALKTAADPIGYIVEQERLSKMDHRRV